MAAARTIRGAVRVTAVVRESTISKRAIPAVRERVFVFISVLLLIG
jgi:hypothetical protein